MLFNNAECHDLIDPIVLNDIDDSNVWIVGELDGDGEDAEDELVFDDDVLTWRDVASASETVEPFKYTKNLLSILRGKHKCQGKKENEWWKKRMKMNQVKMKGRKSTILVVMGVMKTMTWNLKGIKKTTIRFKKL
ncbi:hypothetical protein CR513_50626, partial [Mucuna pruriens]